MLRLIAVALALALAFLAALHLYWAAGGRAGMGAAVPYDGARPLLRPGPIACVLVALALALAGAFALGAEGSLRLPAVPHRLLRAGAAAAGAVLVLRAIGDFRWVGFFKAASPSRFAWLDTRVYSPLCLLLGLGLCACALWGRQRPPG